jgi:Ca2+-binding EF-hand superfamily protein
LFSLYDLAGDGFIDKSELTTMLHNTFQETMSMASLTENHTRMELESDADNPDISTGSNLKLNKSKSRTSADHS